MLPNNLRFICAQPDDDYFVWQVEVLLTNFREKGISERADVLIFYTDEPGKKGVNKNWDKVVKKYKEVRFFFYDNPGLDLNLYIPILRPNILKRHFKHFEDELKDKIFFYHDCDIIFNYLPDFNLLCSDTVCWESDTSSYTDYTYLNSKEKQGNIDNELVIRGLASIGGVTPEIIKNYDKKTGGAQYLLKNIDSGFWEDVENMCIRIRRYLMEEINPRYFKSENDGFQSWCADIWAVNFSLWKRGLVTDITDKLDFSWATDHIDSFYKKPIYHNAGATPRTKGLFFKGSWQLKSPLGLNLPVSKNFASSKYVEAIRKVKI